MRPVQTDPTVYEQRLIGKYTVIYIILRSVYLDHLNKGILERYSSTSTQSVFVYALTFSLLKKKKKKKKKRKRTKKKKKNKTKKL